MTVRPSPLSSPAFLPDVPLLRTLVECVPEALWISRPTGEIVFANPAFLALVGVPDLAAARRLRLGDVFADPEVRASFATRLAADGAVRDVEAWVVRVDGELRRVLAGATSACDVDDGSGPLVHGVMVDVTRHHAREVSLLDQSTRDALTGCHNRRWLDALAARLDAPGAQWGCIYLDVDRFKQYNDTHGHVAGDEVLVRMGQFLMREVRGDEGVVRLGGDEFGIILLDEHAAHTGIVADRLTGVAAADAPTAFTLGWAIREGDEPLARTLDRADQRMLQRRSARLGGGR